MQNYMQPQQFRPQYRAIPVSSEAEINSMTVDFNGMPTYFHNQVTNEIFVKQFDMKTGITTLHKYIKFEGDSKPNNESKEENNINLYDEKFNALNERIDGLKQMIKNIREEKGVKNAK